MTTTKKFNTFYFNSKIVCLSLIIFLLVLFFAFTDNHETRSDFQSQTHSSSVIVAIKMLTPSFVTRLSAEIIYNAFLLRLLSLATLPLQHRQSSTLFPSMLDANTLSALGYARPWTLEVAALIFSLKLNPVPGPRHQKRGKRPRGGGGGGGRGAN